VIVDGGFKVLESIDVDLVKEIGGDGFFGICISQLISLDSNVA